MVMKKRMYEGDISSIVLEAPVHFPKKKRFQIFSRRKKEGFPLQAPQKASVRIQEKVSFFQRIFSRKEVMLSEEKVIAPKNVPEVSKEDILRKKTVLPKKHSFWSHIFRPKIRPVPKKKKAVQKKNILERKSFFFFLHRVKEKKAVVQKKPKDWITVEHDLFRKREYYGLKTTPFPFNISLRFIKAKLEKKALQVYTLHKHAKSLLVVPHFHFKKKEALPQAPSPPQKISLEHVPVPEVQRKPFFSFLFRVKEKKAVVQKKPKDWITAEHDLFRKREYYGLKTTPFLFPSLRVFFSSFAQKAQELYSPPKAVESLFPRISLPHIQKRTLSRFPQLQQKKVILQAPRGLPHFPELEQKKELPLAVSPSVIKEPFDILESEHGLFQKMNPFHLRERKYPSIEQSLLQEKREPVIQKALPQQKVSLPELKLSSDSFDPLQKTFELMQKCRHALQRNKLDFAQIFYEEVKPFYLRLSPEQMKEVYPHFVALQQDLEMLRLRYVRQHLKKRLHISFTPPTLSKMHVREDSLQVLPLVRKTKKFHGNPFEHPWEACLDILPKCQRALRQKNYHFAILYSEKLKSLHKKLSSEQQQQLQDSLLEVQQGIEMLELARVHQRLSQTH